ncbi:MAG: AMP-dependent synthetase [Alphaproteobacteria bacterium]|nr:MAG: AMP-dependent synthetase [Alphaproteobacteria bacterium]
MRKKENCKFFTFTFYLNYLELNYKCCRLCASYAAFVTRPCESRSEYLRPSLYPSGKTSPNMTIRTLLDAGADNAVALTAPDRPAMTYAALRRHVDSVGRQLAGNGLGPSDRVAIVLPNGPEMASAFMAVAAYMSAAPLNPAYKESEYAFYLEDLAPKLVIVEAGSENPVRAAASALSIPVVEAVVGDNDPAGAFRLFEAEADATPAGADNEALVLHTSGTTSRPKVVPLMQRNIMASARNIAASLELTDSDHCLNIMPLFHIHGLIAVLATSMSKGASVCCTGGFNALKFLDQARDEKISWYSGVPTMHQAILLRAKRQADAAKGLGLRLIRSSSASLPPAVFEELNDVFECPVIEAYGMTEAAHQMTSNPLGDGKQKAGFVGIATSPEVCIMDQEGNRLTGDAEGEVCIRGDNVTPGYENNPAANESSFTSGWFRTGDQGFFDGDGYLKITGRLKEIINRGGEKVSPLEVDNVLMEHPAIQQVVTFAVADRMLGEEIGAAVVLADGGELDAAGLRAYAENASGEIQDPEAHRVPRRNPERRHRQAAADRPCPEAGPRRLVKGLSQGPKGAKR